MQSWKRSTTISGIKFHSPRGYYLATIQLTRSQNDSGFDIVYQQETRNWMSYELKKSLVFLFLTFVSINRFPWTFQFSFASLARRKLFLMFCSEPNNLLATFQTSTGPWALVKTGWNCLRHSTYDSITKRLRTTCVQDIKTSLWSKFNSNFQNFEI